MEPRRMLLSVTVVLMLISSACGENPGLQLVLNNKGLQYGKHVGAGWIQDKLELITLPDINGEVDLRTLGTVYYTLSGINIVQCDFPEPSVEFYKDATGFKSSILGLSVAIEGEWRTHYGIIKDHGSFNMALLSVDVTSIVNLGKDPEGRLSVTSASCDAQVGDVNIHFHGGASWIIQRFVNYFKGHIKGEIEGKICPDVEQSIVMLEDSLQAMNVSFDVNQDLNIDLPLSGLPIIDASSLNLGLKGEFLSIKTPKVPPFDAQPFTIPEQPSYMLSMGLSEYTLNSASYGYYSAGLLKALINDSMIPPRSPVHLNTSSMGPFIPQLPKLFPDLLMNLQVSATDFPLFSFLPGVVDLGIQGGVMAFAIQKNGTETALFELKVDTKFSSQVWIAGGKLKGSLKMNNFTLTLASSKVGPFETDKLEGLGRMAIQLVVTNLNEKLGEGVVLPRMRQAQLVNTVLEVEKGFIAVFSDAQVLMADEDFN
ncbi:lipopolysaccharide-binding protein [Notolabrus celidotus]|uniref:lipopolysaccharide-binding protein n=1 Tax=Notolabrus celidotus TaxID=1203425 RepID=UPI00148FAC92|nr:lipopolysaccharide-binding protein [Notolabrus celidotus]